MDRRQNCRTLWYGIAVLFVVTLFGIAVTGLRIDFSSNTALLVECAGYAAIVAFYRYVRPDERLSEALTAVAQLFIILMLGLLLTYAATTIAMPYRDQQLQAIDTWLGFDRASYVRFFTDQPWKIRVSDFVYLIMLPQLAIVPLVMIVTNRIERLQRFIAAYGVALIMTIAIFVFVPAVGAFVHVDITPAQYAVLPLEIYTPARTLDALRSGFMKTIELNNLEGLIAFPSFHTAAAILYAWAFWPLKTLRWPALLFNTALVATTPIGGAHYAIDVVAGAAVALVAIAVSSRLRARDARPLGAQFQAGVAVTLRRTMIQPEQP
jgi:membrane-associated phospholipid phosphatase